MSEDNKPSDSLNNFGMIIPTSCTPIKKYPKYFGWSCISMKKWVGIRYYKRIVPVRADKIFDFLFWRFVKPIKQKPGTMETITYITNRTTNGKKEERP